MFTRRQVVASTAIVPAAGLLGLPCRDSVQNEVERIVVLAEALIDLPLSPEHERWATTIRDLVAHMPVAIVSDSGYRECRTSLSPLMGYSEFLGLHYPAGSEVKMLTKQITAATGRIDNALSDMAR